MVLWPSSPAVDDELEGPFGEVYRFDGVKWTLRVGGGAGRGGTARVEISDTPPADPLPGDLWWDSEQGQLYIRYIEQWVVVVNQAITGGAGSQVVLSAAPPPSPEVGTLWWDVSGAQLYLFTGVGWIIVVNAPGSGGGAPPPEPAPVPMSVAFFFPGKPGTGDVVVVPIVTSLTIPANLDGSSVYALEAATADADFELWHRDAAGGAVSQIGTVTLQAGNSGAFTGAGTNLAAGDALLLYAPTTADATLENVGITIMAYRSGTGGAGGAEFNPNTTGSGNTFVLQQGPTINQPRVMGLTDGVVAAAGEVGEIYEFQVGVTVPAGYSYPLIYPQLTAGAWEAWVALGVDQAPADAFIMLQVQSNGVQFIVPPGVNYNSNFLPAGLGSGNACAIRYGPLFFNLSEASAATFRTNGMYLLIRSTVDFGINRNCSFIARRLR